MNLSFSKLETIKDLEVTHGNFLIKPQTINKRKTVVTHFIHIPCQIYRSQFSFFMIFHNDPQIGFVMTSFYEYCLIKCPFSFIENYIAVLVGLEIKESIYTNICSKAISISQTVNKHLLVYLYIFALIFEQRYQLQIRYLFYLVHLTPICDEISLFLKEVKK